MKIIFDRSAFHRKDFDLLQGSRLLELVHENRLTAYHTSTFINETIRTAGSRKPGAAEEIKRLWPFVRSACNGGWFKPLLFGDPPKWKSVCDEELGGGARERDWPLVPSSSRTNIEERVNKFLAGDGPLPELSNAQAIYHGIEQTKKDNRSLRLKLRTEETLPKKVTFEEYHRAHFFDAARLLIHRPRYSSQLQALAPLEEPEATLEAWKSAPEK